MQPQRDYKCVYCSHVRDFILHACARVFLNILHKTRLFRERAILMAPAHTFPTYGLRLESSASAFYCVRFVFFWCTLSHYWYWIRASHLHRPKRICHERKCNKTKPGNYSTCDGWDFTTHYRDRSIKSNIKNVLLCRTIVGLLQNTCIMSHFKIPKMFSWYEGSAIRSLVRLRLPDTFS